MKFEDVLNEDGTVKEFYTLPVKDEKFKQDIYLNTKVKEALLDYVQSIGVKRENYVFQSNKTPNSITRQQAYRVIHNAAEELELLVRSERIQCENIRISCVQKRDSDCAVAKTFSSRDSIRDAKVFRYFKG